MKSFKKVLLVIGFAACSSLPVQAQDGETHHHYHVRRPVAHRIVHGTRNVVRGAAYRVGSALKALFGRRSHDSHE